MDPIPLNSFKREEIYSFIGGFFVASLWCLYFASSNHDTNLSDITDVTKLRFLLIWLFSTAVLYMTHFFLFFVIYFFVNLDIRGKDEKKLKKILGLEGLGDCYIFLESVNELRMQNHVIGIIITGISLALIPLYEFIRLFIAISFCSYCWIFVLSRNAKRLIENNCL